MFSRVVRTTALFAVLFLHSIAASAQGQQLDANGYSIFPLSQDSRVIYVSSSQGNDANDGLSSISPKRSIGAGWNLMRNGFPDHLRLKRGDSWNETFSDFTKSGRSLNERLVVEAYGSGARPKIIAGTGNSVYGFRNDSSASNPSTGYAALTDLTLTAQDYDGSNGTPSGISLLGLFHDITVENVYIDNVVTGIVFQTNPSVYHQTNMQIRKSIVRRTWRSGPSVHPQAAYLAAQDKLVVEGNLFDHCGWREDVPSAVPTIFRHCIYIQYDGKPTSYVGDNIFYRSASEGLQLRGGGLAWRNLFIDNTGNFVGSGGIASQNVVLDSHDIDSSLPRGLGFSIDNAFLPSELVDNIVAHRTNPASWNMVGLGVINTSSTIVQNNIVYDWFIPGAAEPKALDIESGAVTVAGNDFQMPNGGVLINNRTSAGIFSGNRYYSSNSNPFVRGSSGMNFSAWTSATGDGSLWSQRTYFAPNRTAATYIGGLGFPATNASFIDQVALQDKVNYRPELHTAVVVNHIREGFNKPAATQRPAMPNFGSSSSSVQSSVVASSSSAPATSAPASSTATTSSAASTSSIAASSSSVSSAAMGGSFVGLPATIVVGSAPNLTLTLTGNPAPLDVVFQVWTAAGTVDAAVLDTAAPYVYPASALNTVTHFGAGYVQALVRNSQGIMFTVSAPVMFLAPASSSSAASSAPSSSSSSSSSMSSSSSSSSAQTICERVDTSGNGLIGQEDFLVFLSWFNTGNLLADFTNDGLVNIADPTKFLADYASCVPLPISNQPMLSISVAPASVLETGSSPAIFTIRRTGSTASKRVVKFTVSGTARNGYDYKKISTQVTIPAGKASAQVKVYPKRDTVLEPTETVILTLHPGVTFTLAQPPSALAVILDPGPARRR